MDMNPQRVRTAEFRTVKKGLDPDEVQAFLHSVADELERAQNQSTAMEARARAAVARLQELSEDAGSQSAASAAGISTPASVEAAEQAPAVTASVDQSETISRTLLLAQRTADTTVAEARAEAERLKAAAETEASQQLNEARSAARRVGEEERTAMEGEVNSLAARRDFLESDVDHLEQFLVDQRTRLRDAATQIVDLTERVPGGLGEVRRPLVSGSSTDTVTEPKPKPKPEPEPEIEPATETLTETTPEPASEPAPEMTPEPATETRERVEEDLWLPDAVDDGPPAGNPSANG